MIKLWINLMNFSAVTIFLARVVGKNCSAMDESRDFKFTSVEELLEAGRIMELSRSDLEEFVVEQQEYE